MQLDPKKIRLWGGNPRYTDYDKINFQKIGIEDFTLNKLGYLIEDNYDKKINSYYLSLLKNDFYIEKMLELVESISQGFNPDIDEILITRSALINKMGDKFFNEDKNKKNSLYYVLEGNRRLMALHLLLNANDSRNLLEKNTTPEMYEKFNKIFENFETSEIDLNQIEVKFYKTESIDDVKIWKTLNTRHFGKRKGKVNWPRGQVLEFIYQKIIQLREKIGLKIGDKITKEDLKDIKHELENFTGKVISENFDLKNALFVHWAVEVFNKSSDEKISFSNTFDENDEPINEETKDNFFSISSLELSMSQVKLLDDNGLLKTLGNIIKLNKDIFTWEITSNLDKEILESLIIYIIKLIKSNKLNTRKFDENYAVTISKIIKIDNVKNIQNEISKNISKIKFSNVTLGMLISGEKNKIINEIEFSDNDSEKEIELKKIDILYQKTIPALSEILDRTSKAKLFLKDSYKNKFEYSLVRIWEKETISLIKNHNNNVIDDLPVIVFAAIFRITSELFQIWILAENTSQYEDIITASLDNIDLNQKSNQANKLKKHLDEAGETYSEHIKSFIENDDSHNERNIPRADIYTTYKAVTCIISKDENILDNFILEINNNSSNKEVTDSLKKYMNWILNNNVGKRKIVNKLIHEPHYIKTFQEDLKAYEEFNNELQEHIKFITLFMDLIMK